MTDEDHKHEREVVAIRKDENACGHIVRVKLRDGREMSAARVIAEIEGDGGVHWHYVMRPPEGAPAYRAHQETGLLLLLQTRECLDCGLRVLWA